MKYRHYLVNEDEISQVVFGPTHVDERVLPFWYARENLFAKPGVFQWVNELRCVDEVNTCHTYNLLIMVLNGLSAFTISKDGNIASVNVLVWKPQYIDDAAGIFSTSYYAIVKDTDRIVGNAFRHPGESPWMATGLYEPTIKWPQLAARDIAGEIASYSHLLPLI